MLYLPAVAVSRSRKLDRTCDASVLLCFLILLRALESSLRLLQPFLNAATSLIAQLVTSVEHVQFVQGIKHGRQTGFDLDDSDLLEMEQCRGVVVASTKFGAYDLIQPPKNISETAKKNVSFFVFVDEETDTFLRNSTELNSSKKVGLWRIVVIHNLPYDDPRRNGKKGTLLGPLHTRASR